MQAAYSVFVRCTNRTGLLALVIKSEISHSLLLPKLKGEPLLSWRLMLLPCNNTQHVLVQRCLAAAVIVLRHRHHRVCWCWKEEMWAAGRVG